MAARSRAKEVNSNIDYLALSTNKRRVTSSVSSLVHLGLALQSSGSQREWDFQEENQDD